MSPAAPAFVVAAPEPVTLTAPDTNALTKVFTNKIAPLADFKVTDTGSYVKAKGELFLAVTGYLDEAERLFDPACKAAYTAHKAMTGLRSAFTAQADAVKRHLIDEIGRYEREQERIRREEERRLQAEQQAEYERQQALLREQAEALRPPWEEDEPVIVPELPPPAPVRLTSAVPVVAGGAKTANKPWAARLVDLDALWAEALKSPDARQFFSFNQVAANAKARELKQELGKVYPGLEGYQDTTQKRG